MSSISLFQNDQIISLRSIFFRFKWRIFITILLVVLESVLMILYPLFIGWAINDLLQQKYDAVYFLIYLGLSSLLLGSIRRFYDTRVYADIYCKLTPEMVTREKHKGRTVSTISARAKLLTEFVEFFENSMPEVIAAITALFGILIVIFSLNVKIFLASLALFALMILLYWITAKFNYRFNANYNTVLEQQVNVLSLNKLDPVKKHLQDLMLWNIKLSDLETLNYVVIWIAALALMIYAPVTSVADGVLNYGLVFAVLMYVFEYIEKVTQLPLYIQQLIRLREITHRLAD